MADTETDAKGRKLAFRKIGILDQARLLRAIGAEQARNEPYARLVFACAAVEAVNGVPVPLPRTEAQIDALLGQLGDEGAIVAMLRYGREVQEVMDKAEAAMASEEGKPADPLAVSGSLPTTPPSSTAATC